VTTSFTTDDDSAQLCVCLSEATMTGVDSPKSMRLVGYIQGHEMLMLIDSGSSHSFINTELTAKLDGVSPLQSILSVKVANGVPVLCHSQMLNV
jgi:hypothetical protein